MALDTYANLQASIADFLNRTDLTDAIKDFITLAEAQINRDVEHWKREKRATVTASDQYTELPTDFYRPVRLHLQGKDRALQPMSQNEMQDERDATNDASGEPKFYSLTDESIELYPTPGDSYTLEMSYVRTIPALSDSNTSNWLLAEAPDVYLYGALVQSPGYLVEDQRLKTWAALYDQAVRQLNTSSVNAKFGSNLRIRSNQYWS